MTKKQSAREKLLDITFEEVYIHGYTATLVDAILKKEEGQTIIQSIRNTLAIDHLCLCNDR